MPHTLFISDLHLGSGTPEATAALLRFLRETATAADALYVLGDLFEYWIGDDAVGQPFEAEVAAAFRTLADSGVPVYFMRGNRDFLVGRRFARDLSIRSAASLGAGPPASCGQQTRCSRGEP